MNFKNLGFDLGNLFQVKQFGNRFPYHDLGMQCRHGRKYLKLPKMDGFNTKKYQLTSFLRLDPWVYWIQARIKHQKCGSTQLERSLRPSNLNPIAIGNSKIPRSEDPCSPKQSRLPVLLDYISLVNLPPNFVMSTMASCGLLWALLQLSQLFCRG